MAETQELAFFSYAREDSTFALKLAKDLKAAGLSIWIDQLDINPGQRWDRTVEEALASCPRMLVVLSPASVASNNVMDEVSYSLEEGKIVIPILHKDCKIPFRLRRVQYADFRTQYEAGITDLVSTLHRTAALVQLQSGPLSVADQIAVETPEIDAEAAKRAEEERPQREKAEASKQAEEQKMAQPIAHPDAQSPRILSLAEAFERAEAEREAKRAKAATHE